MKLKRLLAATAVATIASSAVMAEGGYIGLEMNDSTVRTSEIVTFYGAIALAGAEAVTNTRSFYVGYESDLTDTLVLDSRLDLIDYTDAEADGLAYSIGLTQEVGNAEVYGKYTYANADSLTHKTMKVGVRYNF